MRRPSALARPCKMIDSHAILPDTLDVLAPTMDRLTRCFLEIRDELLRFLTRRTGRAEAEDVLQDTWLRLHERSDPLSWREPRAVIFRTAANLATDAGRHEALAGKWVSHELARSDESPVHPDPQTELEAERRLERLMVALEQLPAPCREAFLLSRIDGLTHAQIARQLGVSAKSAQRYIERAMIHCLETLDV